MKTYGGGDVQIHIFLTSALVGSERSASRLGRFSFRERDPSTHSTGGWLGLRASFDNMEKRKFLPHLDLNSDRLVIQPIASYHTDW
jgi:hypothetical protein